MNYKNILDLYSTNQSNSLESWIYYLIGALFLVAFFISAFFAYKWYKNPKQSYYNDSIKDFWLKHRSTFMILLSIVNLLSGIVFLMLNNI